MNIPASIKTSLKVRDRFSCVILDNNRDIIGQYEGYVPSFFPGNHYGDYLELKIDLETGQILNWGEEITKLDLIELITKDINYDEFEDEREDKELLNFANKVDVLKISAKVSDSFFCIIYDKDYHSIGEYSGYVPSFFPGNHYGDYVMLDIELKTRKILNWKKVTPEDLENFGELE